jgi:hypothetical protein
MCLESSPGDVQYAFCWKICVIYLMEAWSWEAESNEKNPEKQEY